MGLKDKLEKVKSEQEERFLKRKALQEEWESEVSNLLGQIKSWLSEYDAIKVTEAVEPITEELFGVYELEYLIVDLPTNQRIFIKPIGRFILGAQGRIDFDSSDLHKSVYFIHRETEEGLKWLIVENRNFAQSVELNKNSFENLIEDVIDSRVG